MNYLFAFLATDFVFLLFGCFNFDISFNNCVGGCKTNKIKPFSYITLNFELTKCMHISVLTIFNRRTVYFFKVNKTNPHVNLQIYVVYLRVKIKETIVDRETGG